jgi:hypothetical protein
MPRTAITAQAEAIGGGIGVSDPGRAPRSIGVTARLIALVMIPVVAMCGFSARELVTRSSTAQNALAIDAAVVQLSALVELHSALGAQRSLDAFGVRMSELGVTQVEANNFIGFDIQAQVGQARGRADRALSVLGPANPVSASTLHVLYTDLDAGRLTAADAAGYFDRAERSTAAAIAGEISQLEGSDRPKRTGPLLDALGSVRVMTRMTAAAAPQGIDLSSLWFPRPGASPGAGRAVLARLANETARYDAARVRLLELRVPSVVGGLASIGTDPRVQSFEAAAADALRGESVLDQDPAVPALAAHAVFGGYIARAGLLDALVVTATTAVRQAARELATSERRAASAWAGLAALLTLLSVAMAVGFARSIVKPLRGLADYAHAVYGGRLDADPSTGAFHGPRETRVAFAAFTDLVANLQLLDAKANALATCAFDDPVLRQPLPGRLGNSLERSVAMLSGSIVEREQLQINLAHQVTHDSLTGIANRAAAVVGIQDAIYRSARHGEAMALMFVDLNDFKSINDRLGHEAGDALLREIAARMSACVRTGDSGATSSWWSPNVSAAWTAPPTSLVASSRP